VILNKNPLQVCYYIYFRPMTIKKDLVNNKTAMTGIEMAMV
jgi:hypothetical protein